MRRVESNPDPEMDMIAALRRRLLDLEERCEHRRCSRATPSGRVTAPQVETSRASRSGKNGTSGDDAVEPSRQDSTSFAARSLASNPADDWSI